MSEHRAPSASPRALRFALPAVTVVAASLLAGCGKSGNTVDPEVTASLIQPVAKVELKVVTIPPGSRTGEQIYKSICASCHDAGSLGAPKTGDAAAWKPRLALGHAGLTESAIKGKGSMPARGGGADLTDTEVKRAVAFLANKAGAGYTEPPVEQ